MIKSSLLRSFIWIISLSSITLNIIVVLKSVFDVKKIADRSKIVFHKTVLVINLAVSDSIFGFVLLFLIAKSKEFSGQYCSKDLEWRSSSACSSIGVLRMISSQTSLYLLLLITGFRVYTVKRPFKYAAIDKNLMYLLIFLCWLTSTLISLIPIYFHHQFKLSVLISGNIHLKNKNYDRMVELLVINKHDEKIRSYIF